MQDGTLLLGPVLFQDFEIPDKITWGGAQRVAIHRLPGGGRIIDALGRDDAELAWSGIFSGADAGVRARLLDTLRGEGLLWSLTWNAYFYSVIITNFSADYTRQNWIPYRITCTVLRDEAAALIDATVSLAAAALGDLTAATAFASPVDLGAATAAVAVSGATTSGTAAYTNATSSVGGANVQLSASLTQAETNAVSANDPASAATAAGQLAAITQARAYVQRTAANLANAST